MTPSQEEPQSDVQTHGWVQDLFMTRNTGGIPTIVSGSWKFIFRLIANKHLTFI